MSLSVLVPSQPRPAQASVWPARGCRRTCRGTAEEMRRQPASRGDQKSCTALARQAARISRPPVFPWAFLGWGWKWTAPCSTRHNVHGTASASLWLTTGLPCGMPGMALEMEGAVQQAPQPGRQSIFAILMIACSAHCAGAGGRFGLKFQAVCQMSAHAAGPCRRCAAHSTCSTTARTPSRWSCATSAPCSSKALAAPLRA